MKIFIDFVGGRIMVKKMKTICIMTVAMLILGAGTVFAAESVVNSGNKLLFSDYKIYGSKDRLLASGYVQASPYNEIIVQVDNMYKEDGSASSYTTSRWTITNATTGGIVQSNIAVEEEKKVKVSLGTSAAGVKYGINVKGNNDDKNALISGNISNFNKQ